MRISGHQLDMTPDSNCGIKSAPIHMLRIEKDIQHTPLFHELYPKQWVIVHTSDLMMIYILSIITREMGKLKTHSPTYCIMDN